MWIRLSVEGTLLKNLHVCLLRFTSKSAWEAKLVHLLTPSPSMEKNEKMVPVVLKTQTTYQIPSDTFMLPLGWRRYHLSQLINKVLSLPNPVPFDFIINGELLASSVGEWCNEKNIGEVPEITLYSSLSLF